MSSIDTYIAQHAAYLLSAQGRARSTADSYARDIEQFAELIKLKSIAGFSRQSVLDWLSALSRMELSPGSKARKLSSLRSFAQWALDFGHITENPIPAEVSTAPSLYLPHALSESEIERMLVAAKGPGAQDLRDYALLETMYATGIRVSEVCGLTLNDLELDEGFAVVTGKGNKQRLVPLGEYAIDALREFIGIARGELCKHAPSHAEVFVTRRGPISRSTVFTIVKKYAKLADIKSNVSPHTLRHSCASHLLARGADLRMVQELLGHAALSTTQVYTHIEKSRMRSVYDQSHPLGG